MRLRNVLCGGLMVGLLGVAVPARAAVITGHLGIGGSITYDTLNTSGGAGLDFQFTLPPPTGPTGPFIEISAATDYFAGLNITPFVTTGTILNIDNVPAVPNYTFAPAGVPLAVSDFLNNFNGNGATPLAANLHFDLTKIPVQSGSPCTAATVTTCAEGPFLITQTTNGLRITFDVFGNFINGADSGAYTGSFSVTLNGMTFATLGNRLTVTGQDLACGTNNLTVPCTFDANFDPTSTPGVPEPATLLTFGVGSLVLGRLRHRRNQKKSKS